MWVEPITTKAKQQKDMITTKAKQQKDMHCTKNPIYVFPINETVWPRSQFLNSCICERFTYSQERGVMRSCWLLWRRMLATLSRETTISSTYTSAV
jgi:hypothetical protein